MAVGLVLPPGTKSLANTEPPLQVMDLDAHPYDFPAGSPEFIAAHNRRYGKPKEGNVIADVPGIHATTSAPTQLSEIAATNPGWFAEAGLGRATGSTLPSQEEIHDVQAALLPDGRGRVSELLGAEHVRLFPGGDLQKPGGGSPGGGQAPDPRIKQLEDRLKDAHAAFDFVRSAARDAHARVSELKRPGGIPLRALDGLLEKLGSVGLLALLLATLPLLAGCRTMSGGAFGDAWRILFTGVTTADAEWTGVVTGPAESMQATVVGIADPQAGVAAGLLGQLREEIGVALPVNVPNDPQTRLVFCSKDFRARCLAAVKFDVVEFTGSKAGALYHPKRLVFKKPQP